MTACSMVWTTIAPAGVAGNDPYGAVAAEVESPASPFSARSSPSAVSTSSLSIGDSSSSTASTAGNSHRGRNSFDEGLRGLEVDRRGIDDGRGGFPGDRDISSSSSNGSRGPDPDDDGDDGDDGNGRQRFPRHPIPGAGKFLHPPAGQRKFRYRIPATSTVWLPGFMGLETASSAPSSKDLPHRRGSHHGCVLHGGRRFFNDSFLHPRIDASSTVASSIGAGASSAWFFHRRRRFLCGSFFHRRRRFLCGSFFHRRRGFCHDASSACAGASSTVAFTRWSKTYLRL